MREENIAFDDLAGLHRIVGQGFSAWGPPFHLGTALVAAFHAVIGVKDTPGPVPGVLLQALLPRILPPAGWQATGYRGAINLGSPSIRFPQPLPRDAAVCGRRALLAARPHPKGMLHSLGFEVAGFEGGQAAGGALFLVSTTEILYLGGPA